MKYLNVRPYRNIDLEEFHTEIVKQDLPKFITTTDIERILLKCVKKIISTHMTLKQGQTPAQAFYKLCKRIECLDRPKKVKYDRKESVENLEVYSSFRPSISAIISVQKLEEVAISSDSEEIPPVPIFRANSTKKHDCSAKQEVKSKTSFSKYGTKHKNICGFLEASKKIRSLHRNNRVPSVHDCIQV